MHRFNKILQRLRYQLLLGFALSVMLPVFIRHGFDLSAFFSDSVRYTFIGSSVAMISGFHMVRRLNDFPGVGKFSHILVSFVLTYGLLTILFFIFRLDYSRFIFVASFLICSSWHLILFYWIQQTTQLKYALVKGGNHDEVLNIPGVKWEVLEDTTGYHPDMGPFVADLRHEHTADWERFLADVALKGIPVFHSKQIIESLSGKVPIERLSENTLGSLLPNLIYTNFKHAIDFVLAILLLPFFGLIIVILVPLVKLSSPGATIYRQKRVGFRGQVFYIYKLRTMEETNTPVSEATRRTAPKDKRITPIGRFLRKYRFDELPQIINILRGEMSWIGPRPEAIELSEWYEKELPFYSYRHIVKPGISGWAQINQGHVTEPEHVLEKLHYDFFYIKNFSIWLDFLIVIKTIRTLVSGFGAK